MIKKQNEPSKIYIHCFLKLISLWHPFGLFSIIFWANVQIEFFKNESIFFHQNIMSWKNVKRNETDPLSHGVGMQ